MASDVGAFLEAWQADRQKMKAEAPDLARGFGAFYQTVMKEGALSARKRVDRPGNRPGGPLHAVYQPSRARLPQGGSHPRAGPGGGRCRRADAGWARIYPRAGGPRRPGTPARQCADVKAA